MKYDLSIVIPALKEEWLGQTIENIMKNKRGKTEVIAVLDGEWSPNPLTDHPDVRIVKLGTNVGQRKATNIGARLSSAKYIAKCDAHCAFDEGFDVKLMDALKGHDDWTIVPVMKNLHAFDWVCDNCEMRVYQGKKPDRCRSETCTFDEQSFHKEVVFEPRTKEKTGWNSPSSSAYKFTPDNLQFKYFGMLKRRQDREKETIAETMSLQGSFFMLTRDKYWELNICDETWGGWGQQGTEVALKTWLSGGRVVVHRETWYAHLFRTEDEFAFPWNVGLKESQGRQQRRSRKMCIDLFKNNAWNQQVRPLSWLVERFWDDLQEEARHGGNKDDRPWTQDDLAKLKKTEGRFNQKSTEKGVIYYTDNQLNIKLAKKVQNQIKKSGLPIVSASLKPMDKMGVNIHIRGERGVLSYFRQIVTALEVSTAEYVFFCEHDVLYHPSHFDFTPPTKDKFYYNTNVWRVRDDGFAVTWEANQVAELCCARELALEFYREKLKQVEVGAFDRSYEPGGRDSTRYEQWRSEFPNIDIRHDGNMTKSKWSPSDFRDKSTCVNWQESTVENIPGWNNPL